MSLNYSIAMLSNPQDKNAPAKAYAKAQINGEMSLDCRRDHRARGFADIGYHYYITRDHGEQRRSGVGICYEGGLDAEGRPADTRTPQQKYCI